nr:hypothetical protein [Tanacetum cinerariifolium]
MAAFIIPISSYSSEESVGSYILRVIIFGSIPTIILVILVVPTEVLIVPADPLVASEGDNESEPAEQRNERHESLVVYDTMVLRWRDGVASRPSSSSRSSSHDTLAPPSEPYRTYLNGPRNLLTARKRVGPFLARRLAWRHVSHRSLDCHSSPNFTSDLSSSGSSSDSSSDTLSGPPLNSLSDTSSFHSLGFDASGQSHSGPSTKVASSRSPTTLVPSSTLVSRSIPLTHAELLPPRMRLRDPYSPEDSIEEHVEIDTADAEAVTDLGISDEVGAQTKDGIGMGVKIAASDIKEDEEEFETAHR